MWQLPIDQRDDQLTDFRLSFHTYAPEIWSSFFICYIELFGDITVIWRWQTAPVSNFGLIRQRLLILINLRSYSFFISFFSVEKLFLLYFIFCCYVIFLKTVGPFYGSLSYLEQSHFILWNYPCPYQKKGLHLSFCWLLYLFIIFTPRPIHYLNASG